MLLQAAQDKRLPLVSNSRPLWSRVRSTESPSESVTRDRSAPISAPLLFPFLPAAVGRRAHRSSPARPGHALKPVGHSSQQNPVVLALAQQPRRRHPNRLRNAPLGEDRRRGSPFPGERSRSPAPSPRLSSALVRKRQCSQRATFLRPTSIRGSRVRRRPATTHQRAFPNQGGQPQHLDHFFCSGRRESTTGRDGRTVASATGCGGAPNARISKFIKIFAIAARAWRSANPAPMQWFGGKPNGK